MNKNIKKALVILGGAGVGAIFSQVLGSWLPFTDTLPTTLGLIGAGAATGFFGYDEIIEGISNAKEKILKAFSLEEDDEYEYDYEDEEEYKDEITEVYEKANEDSPADTFSEAFYFDDDYYKEIIKFYRDAGSFREAKEIYCKSRGLEFDETVRTYWDIEFFKEALITIVDVCSDRIMDTATCDADVAAIINNMAYKMVYDAAYYTIVNGMTDVDSRNIINSIYNDEEEYTFEERKEITDRLCSMTGVVNPLTRKYVALDEGNESGKGRIIKFANTRR